MAFTSHMYGTPEKPEGLPRFLPRTVPATLLLLLIVLLLPVLLLESVLHYQRFLSEQQEGYRNNTELARAVANSFEAFVHNVTDQELAIGIALGTGRLSSADAIDLLTASVETHSPVLSYSLADGHGRIVASSNLDAIGVSIAQRPYFRAAAAAPKVAVTDVLRDPLAREPVFVIARPMRDPQGSLLAVIVALVDPTHLDDHVRVDNALGAVTIYDHQGQGVYSSNSASRAAYGNPVQIDPLLLRALDGEVVAGAFRPEQGLPEFATSFVPVAELGWVVGVGTLVDDIVAPAVEDLLRETGLYVLIGLVAIPFAIIISTRITRPIRALREHAWAVGKGELGRSVSVQGVTELVELAAAFNVMSKEIQLREAVLEDHVFELEQAQASLSRARDELEVRVQERTAKLTSSEARFRSVVQTAVNAIILVDSSGHVVFWNHAAEVIFGYSADEIIGCSLGLVIPEGELHDHIDHVHAALSAGDIGQNGRTFERMAKRKDGSEFPAELSVGLLHDGASTLLIGIARDITVKRQTDERLKQSVETLRQTLERTVQAMAMAIEMRDPYTAGHQRRVADLASSIAREMGLTEPEILVVRLSATVHDIGKISVPAEILVKPGVINEWELDLIKAHAKTGYDILKTIQFPWPIADIVYQHHERIDGTGYPRGLKIDDILIEARIIAVADVVEAMASDRPYRPALGIEAALAEVSQHNQAAFDPRVVAACLRVFLRPVPSPLQ